jgi:L-aminopeptidase/D-esterase-like protein
VTQDGVTVDALVVVNAIGDLVDGTGPRVFDPARSAVSTGENTTVGIVMTDARLDKLGCRLVAESAHDGLARVLDPVHTAADGVAFVAAATGDVTAQLSIVRSLTTWVVGRAVEDALATAS